MRACLRFATLSFQVPMTGSASPAYAVPLQALQVGTELRRVLADAGAACLVLTPSEETA